MAFDFSKLNFLKGLGARSRVFVLLGVVIGLIFLVYLGTSMLSGEGGGTGASRVAGAPKGLQSVPGGQQSPEFSRAVEQASAQRAQEAQITGESAVPTLVRMQQPGASGEPCVICTEQTANVSNNIKNWVKDGSLSPEVAKQLNDLAVRNVSVSEYANQLDALVKAGKLTPAQARELLNIYKKQHADNLLHGSEKAMDQMIKSGQVPLDVANELLELQKKQVSPSDYAAKLQELVKEGKISKATAQKLLSQYTQQRARVIVAQSIESLHQMARKGQITPDVEKELVELENKMVAVDLYAAKLKSFVDTGKMTPAVSKAILDEFKWQKSAIGPTATLEKLLRLAEDAAERELKELLKTGKMTPDTASFIRGMIAENVSMTDFKTGIGQLVQQKKLTQDIAPLKIADYQAIKGYRDLLQALGRLQGNNASAAEYAEVLKKAVQDGVISPELAGQLMQEYLALMSSPQAAPAIVSGAGTEEFAKLQQRLQQGAPTQAVPAFSEEEFALAPQAQAGEEGASDQYERIQQMMAAMSGQAQQLISSWQPPSMAYKAGTSEAMDKGKGEAGKGGAQEGGESSSAENSGSGSSAAPLIKGGTILFAVLDTTVNSDYPDSPVMATVVDGKYKGSKLLGKLVTTKGVAGQLDRISLNFTLMNKEDWAKSKPVTAYAIDPDSARTALASNVNYHYLQRFGAIMATSFLQGYSTAVTTSSSNSTTGIFGTSTTHPELSPANKLAVGLGQIGQALGNVTQNYANIPPTVTVDSGVGLGILFMTDVT